MTEQSQEENIPVIHEFADHAHIPTTLEIAPTSLEPRPNSPPVPLKKSRHRWIGSVVAGGLAGLGTLVALPIGVLVTANLGYSLLSGLYTAIITPRLSQVPGGDEGLSMFAGPAGAILGGLLGGSIVMAVIVGVIVTLLVNQSNRK